MAAVRLDRELPLPAYAKPGDAGLDLRASEFASLEPGERRLVPTGLAVAIPEGHAGFVVPRSGLGHLGQLEALLAQPEDAPLGDVENLAFFGGRHPPAERDLLDDRDELRVPALPDDGQPSLLDCDREPARREGPDEHHLLAPLADIDESSAADQPPRETAHVDIPRGIALGHAEDRHVETTAVDEVEHGGMIDDGLGIHGRSEVETAHGDSADDAGVDGERHQI